MICYAQKPDCPVRRTISVWKHTQHTFISIWIGALSFFCVSASAFPISQHLSADTGRLSTVFTLSHSDGIQHTHRNTKQPIRIYRAHALHIRKLWRQRLMTCGSIWWWWTFMILMMEKRWKGILFNVCTCWTMGDMIFCYIVCLSDTHGTGKSWWMIRLILSTWYRKIG
jgi:hypothetical protein